MKLSVIDLGYNSVKLVCYKVNSDGTFRAYDRRSIKTKIGRGLTESGYLSEVANRDTIESLRLFRDILVSDDVKNILAVATSAVREAKNRNRFISNIYEKTGFSFRILSHKEESYYSWCGALHSTCISDALFFDLGGGSLELVHSQDFKIRNHLSLPLGALRMARMLNQKNGDTGKKYARKHLMKLEQRILKSLPDRKQFAFSPDVTIVGVGGTLRTVAQYDQDLTNYPLDKIDNYKMKIEHIEEIAEKLSGMSIAEITEIVSIGSSRADTVVPGCYVISSLMRKLGYDSIIVSTAGLREGLVLSFVNYTGYLSSDNIQPTLRSQVEHIVKTGCKRNTPPSRYHDFLETLLSAGLLKEREHQVLIESLQRIRQFHRIHNTNTLFYALIEANYKNLSHGELLVLGLSIIYSKKQKASNRLFAKYKPILHTPQNKRSIEKISSCLNFIGAIEKSQATIHYVMYDGNIFQIDLGCNDLSKFPKYLFEEAKKSLMLSLGISVDYNVHLESNDIAVKVEDKNLETDIS
jgi:exopolyphosphatase / guanosine-5'-triphosphate,3'-diphosphate pyrophosphatase